MKTLSLIKVMIDLYRKRKVIHYLVNEYPVLDNPPIRASELEMFILKKTHFLSPFHWYLTMGKYPLSKDKYYKRFLKIHTYLDSCIKNGYIKYSYEDDFYIEITDKGNQLLNWDDFMLTVFKKYGESVLLVIKWLFKQQ